MDKGLRGIIISSGLISSELWISDTWERRSVLLDENTLQILHMNIDVTPGGKRISIILNNASSSGKDTYSLNMPVTTK